MSLDLDDFWKAKMQLRCKERGHEALSYKSPGEDVRCRWCHEDFTPPPERYDRIFRNTPTGGRR